MKATSSETAASGAGRPTQHLVGDAGELGDLGGERHDRIDERREGVDDLRSAHDRGADLDDLVAVRVVAGGLEIDDRDLVLESEDRGPRALRQRRIGGAHVRVGSGHEVGVEWFRSHPPRVARGSDTKRPDRGDSRPSHNASGAPRRTPRVSAIVVSVYSTVPPMVRDSTYQVSPTFLNFQV